MQKVELIVMGYRCERCGHEWVPIKTDTPRLCPGCKSAYWDTPRPRPAVENAVNGA